MRLAAPPRTVSIALSLALLVLPGYGPCISFSPSGLFEDGISDDNFARIITDTSEPSGYFWSDNYISNETSYLHVIDALPRERARNRVYLGVGPNQNFTYIAHLEPELAFIVDVRRDNLIEHHLFKALILEAETRGAYLSLLLGRPLSDRALKRDAPLALIIQELEQAPPDEAQFRANLDSVKRWFSGQALAVTDGDVRNLELIYGEFFRQGMNIKYDSWRSFFFPSLKEFILEKDLSGRQRNWLASAEHYELIRRMHQANRIIPLVGDFAGETTFSRLGRLLKEHSAVVSAFYVSNVEFYLFRQRKWGKFVDNVRHLPIDEHSVFIRAYANLNRPHPQMVDDHITVTLVQNIERFLESERAGRYQTLWDVVTER